MTQLTYHAPDEVAVVAEEPEEVGEGESVSDTPPDGATGRGLVVVGESDTGVHLYGAGEQMRQGQSESPTMYLMRVTVTMTVAIAVAVTMGALAVAIVRVVTVVAHVRLKLSLPNTTMESVPNEISVT